MIKSELKKVYWKIVQDCLVQFHHRTESSAYYSCDLLRIKIEKPPNDGMISELFYNFEPFYVACQIARNEIDFNRNKNEYGKILNKYGW